MVKAKDNALQDMLQEGDVPLRDGVAKLIDDALAVDARVGLLCGTMSQKVVITLLMSSLLHRIATTMQVSVGFVHQLLKCGSSWCRRRMLAAQSPLLWV